MATKDPDPFGNNFLRMDLDQLYAAELVKIRDQIVGITNLYANLFVEIELLKAELKEYLERDKADI